MIQRHISRCLIAGFVALLPIGGLVLTIVYLEDVLSEAWLEDQSFYFPGLGLIAATVLLYVLGLIVTTLVGRWIFARIDRFLSRLPLFGSFYATLKQILGYDTGEGAIFREVVLVASENDDGEELGLVTDQLEDNGETRTVVFVPGAPNPAAGRLVILPPSKVRPLNLKVDAALKALVSLGKTDLSLDPAQPR